VHPRGAAGRRHPTATALTDRRDRSTTTAPPDETDETDETDDRAENTPA
jgi:hypothetical protein